MVAIIVIHIHVSLCCATTCTTTTGKEEVLCVVPSACTSRARVIVGHLIQSYTLYGNEIETHRWTFIQSGVAVCFPRGIHVYQSWNFISFQTLHSP